jgi:hypothetical protein
MLGLKVHGPGDLGFDPGVLLDQVDTIPPGVEVESPRQTLAEGLQKRVNSDR